MTAGDLCLKAEKSPYPEDMQQHVHVSNQVFVCFFFMYAAEMLRWWKRLHACLESKFTSSYILKDRLYIEMDDTAAS